MQQRSEVTFQEGVRKNLVKNSILSIADGGIYAFAMGMAPLTTVIVYFMSNFVTSKTILGLLTTLNLLLMYTPQILMSRGLERRRLYKPNVLIFGAIQRTLWLLLGLSVLFISQKSRMLFIVIFYIIFSLIGLFSGFSEISFLNFIMKLIPNDYRIKFFGIRSTISGACEALGAIVMGIIVSKFPYPYNYGILFITISIITFISLIIIAYHHEPESQKETQHINWKSYIGKLINVLKTDRNFVNYLLTVILIGAFGRMIFSFHIVYAKEKLGITAQHVAISTFIVLLSQTIGYFIWGIIGSKEGPKRTLELSALIFLPAILFAYIISSIPVFYISIALYGIAQSARNVNENNFVVNLAVNEQNRPSYLGLRNLLGGPFFAFKSVIAGFLFDFMGYGIVFILSTLSALLGFYILFWHVREIKN